MIIGLPSHFCNCVSSGNYSSINPFIRAYLIPYQDLALDFAVIGESFETSVPWSRVLDVCRNVRTLLLRESRRHGIQYPVLATSRYFECKYIL